MKARILIALSALCAFLAIAPVTAAEIKALDLG